MLSIIRTFQFEAAHNLPNYKGKCRNLHGHSYFLEVGIGGKVNKRTGMIMDFGDIKQIVNRLVLDKLDHSYLNNTFKNPTAEEMVKWIVRKLKKEMKVVSVRLWETSNSCAEWRAE